MQFDGNTLTPSQLAMELAGPLLGPAWYLVGSSQPGLALIELRDGLKAVGVPSTIQSLDNPDGLIALCDGVLLVHQLRDWDHSAYAALERLRARIRERHERLVWFATTGQAAALARYAPNFASFIGAQMGAWSEGSMSDAEVEAQLESLRRLHGRTDTDVIELAERGELDGDADHHAWLILLGRGDLIASTRER